MVIATAALLSGCAEPCELLCARLTECNLADGAELEACAARCEEALPADDDRAECVRCADRVACADLPACGTICPLDAGGAELPELSAPGELPPLAEGG